jgi:hypothetical protein
LAIAGSGTLQTGRYQRVGASLKFGQTYRHKIGKMAIVGDKRWHHLIANACGVSKLSFETPHFCRAQF